MPELTLPGNSIQIPYSMPRAGSSYIPELPQRTKTINMPPATERKKFSSRIASHDPQKIVQPMLTEINMIAG